MKSDMGCKTTNRAGDSEYVDEATNEGTQEESSNVVVEGVSEFTAKASQLLFSSDPIICPSQTLSPPLSHTSDPISDTDSSDIVDIISPPSPPRKSVSFPPPEVLEQVKYFLRNEPPESPIEYYEYSLLKSPISPGPPRSLVTSGTPVILESCNIHPYSGRIIGSVLVKNLSFEKEVVVRYTLDLWQTWREIGGIFKHSTHGECDENTDEKNEQARDLDRFMFTLDMTKIFDKSFNSVEEPRLNSSNDARSIAVHFAIRYECQNGGFWDNNQGNNYFIQIQQKAVVSSNHQASILSRTLECLSLKKKRSIDNISNRYSFIDTTSKTPSPPSSPAMLVNSPISPPSSPHNAYSAKSYSFETADFNPVQSDFSILHSPFRLPPSVGENTHLDQEFLNHQNEYFSSKSTEYYPQDRSLPNRNPGFMDDQSGMQSSSLYQGYSNSEYSYGYQPSYNHPHHHTLSSPPHDMFPLHPSDSFNHSASSHWSRPKPNLSIDTSAVALKAGGPHPSRNHSSTVGSFVPSRSEFEFNLACNNACLNQSQRLASKDDMKATGFHGFKFCIPEGKALEKSTSRHRSRRVRLQKRVATISNGNEIGNSYDDELIGILNKDSRVQMGLP
ncbi:putative phosphatase regulatory subunit-domain-containing protein [Paraphysoderma sedebokerense]|nr:putative phosphatase regulatory subunit-domain-containing protein [Paraphysoderma sedebokerense]